MKNFNHKTHDFPGIYQIINTINGTSYIGSAKSVYYRTRQHLSKLRKNQHFAVYFQRSFNKYGEDNFTAKVLEQCNKESLLGRETYWIKELKPEFNTVQTPERVEITEEMKNKISITLKRKYKEGLKAYNQSHNHKWVEIYDKSGRILNRYSSLAEAERALGLAKGRIAYYTGSGVRLISDKYQYKSERSIHKIEDLTNYKPKTNNKKIRATSLLDGSIIEFGSIVECCKYFGVYPAYIQCVMKRYKKPIFRETYKISYV